ncbi:MAG TPA: FmdB family zinc ribbon protein [Candidatus Dormibacteraeota bacterium]|nr:FmdB family zinc ribbon protein [Candidatus Dormibacteraeota bacterium]
MPIHDYRCAQCGRRFQRFFRSFADVRDPAVCPHCGAAAVSRMPPRVRLVRSEESRLEDLADPSAMGDVDESDPRSVARWAKRMGGELGEDMGPELDEAIEEMGDEKAAGDGAGGPDDDAEDDDL